MDHRLKCKDMEPLGKNHEKFSGSRTRQRVRRLHAKSMMHKRKR